MPLDGDEEWGAVVHGFDGLDHAILGADCRGAEACPKRRNCLMMAGVDRQAESVAREGSFGRVAEATKRGVGPDGGGVGYGDRRTSCVVDGEHGQVLEQRPTSPGVDGLQAVADAEDGLAGSLGVFKQCKIRCLARLVGCGGCRIRLLTITARVDVGRTAG